jgi:hypothetical protein
MSLESWKEEFYPVEAQDMNHSTEKDCLQHSLKKWEGLTKENLDKHHVRVGKYPQLLIAGRGLGSLRITSNSCALCVKNLVNCSECILQKTLPGTCGEATSPYEFITYKHDNYLQDFCSGCAYDAFKDNEDPRPMIEALQKTLKLIQK